MQARLTAQDKLSAAAAEAVQNPDRTAMRAVRLDRAHGQNRDRARPHDRDGTPDGKSESKSEGAWRCRGLAERGGFEPPIPVKV